MPTVPAYQANRVGPVSITGARHQAANIDNGIGRAVEGFGNSLNDAAIAQDNINAQLDDTASRKLTIEYQQKAGEIVTGFEANKGLTAVEKRLETQKALADLRDDVLGRTTTGRMRDLTDERVAGYHAADNGRVANYAVKELNAETIQTKETQKLLATEGAVNNWQNPELMEQYIQTATAVLDDLAADHYGWSETTLEGERQKLESGIHRTVFDNFLADDDVDGAEAYYEANMDRLIATDRLGMTRELKAPLENREAYTDYSRAVGNISPIDGTPVADAGPLVEVFPGMALATPSSKMGDPRDGGKRSHNGEDFPMPVGTPLKAAAGGTVKVWTDKAGGKSVALVMDNGDRLGIAHLSEHKVKDGARVEKGQVIALSGNTGVGTGPHAHLTVTLKGGEKVSPSEYLSKAQSPANAPRRWDKNQVYGQIDALAKAESWSFERTERVKARADKEIARDEQLVARQENQADNDASDIVLDLGDNFTSTKKIPREIWDEMSISAKQTYTRIAAVNSKSSAPKANGPDALGLKLLAINEPDKFMERGLGQYVGKLTPGELVTMAEKQAKMRKENPKDANLRSGISGAIGWGKKYGGVELKDADFVAVYDIMEAELSASLKASPRTLSDKDYEAAFRSATRSVRTSTSFIGIPTGSSEKPRYSFKEGNIPDKVMSKVRASAQAVYGKDATDEQIEKTYRLGLGRQW